ncbi:transposase [Agromyces sp. S2-1-8]|uniref:transposase n=1 Tax=Agromyces sp. S2-1-8 TaxID=2897180 RepID=UPI0035AC161E
MNTAWPLTMVQTCIIQLIRNPFRSHPGTAGRRWATASGWSTLRRPKQPRPNGSVSSTRSGASNTRRSAGCGTTRGRSSFRFLDWDIEIRRAICSTNAIESLNAPQPPRPLGARGHFPNAGAALKYLYLVTRSLDLCL